MNGFFTIALILWYTVMCLVIEQVLAREAANSGKPKQCRNAYLFSSWFLLGSICFALIRFLEPKDSLLSCALWALGSGTVIFLLGLKDELQAFNLLVGKKLADSLPV